MPLLWLLLLQLWLKKDPRVIVRRIVAGRGLWNGLFLSNEWQNLCLAHQICVIMTKQRELYLSCCLFFWLIVGIRVSLCSFRNQSLANVRHLPGKDLDRSSGGRQDKPREADCGCCWIVVGISEVIHPEVQPRPPSNHHQAPLRSESPIKPRRPHPSAVDEGRVAEHPFEERRAELKHTVRYDRSVSSSVSQRFKFLF